MTSFPNFLKLLFLLLSISMLSGGCASLDEGSPKLVVGTVPFVTKSTGNITIKRQEFVTAWSSVQVVYEEALAGARSLCESPECSASLNEDRCSKLQFISEQGRIIKVTVDAQLKNPESEVDWENVMKLLGLIAKFVM